MQIFKTRRGVFLATGAFLALIGVIVGAAASHALKTRLDPQALDWIDIGHRYLVWHCLALIALDCLPGQSAWRGLAGYCFLAGILFFTGSLWLMGLFAVTGLGLVTPVGGLLLMAGWAALILLAIAWMRENRET